MSPLHNVDWNKSIVGRIANYDRISDESTFFWLIDEHEPLASSFLLNGKKLSCGQLRRKREYG